MAGSVTDPLTSFGSILSRRKDFRSQSFSSDRASVSTAVSGAATLPVTVSPEAAFINESSASQIISNSFDASASNWYDQNGVEPSAEPIRVSPVALHLVNSFLDQLLFSFLQAAKSTSLAALRPAVGEVLKPKLARDTILNANEELREYLGDADEDEYAQPDHEASWDLELAWKRARLRCMVYSSLGELEEEDEDLFMQQENLETLPNQGASEVISAAVAIFLTSVIEYMGELTLTVAGQSAFHRVQAKLEKAIKDGTRKPHDVADCIIIEEKDMERVALDRTLGRLWRTWKKKLRSPTDNSPPVSFTALPGEPADGEPNRRQSLHRRDDHAAVSTRSETGSPSMEGKMGTAIELYGTEQLSEDESELAAREFLTLARRRPVSLGDTPTYVSGLQIATIAERHPAVLMLHRRFSMPSPRPPTLHRDSARPRTFNRAANAVPEAEIAPKAYRQRMHTSGIRDSFGARPPWDGEDVLEQATYEKAEIVKSSRVSLASISSRSISEFGASGAARRVSGDHSARIIDVPASKSPVQSLRQSIDAADRVRPSSGPDPIHRSNFPFPEEQPKVQEVDHTLRFGLDDAAPKPDLPDKVSSSLPGTAVSSESDKEASDRLYKAHAVTNDLPTARAQEPLGRVPHALQTNLGQAERKTPSPKPDPPAPVTKVTIIRGPHVANIAGDEDVPEMHRKPVAYPVRQSSKVESRTPTHAERTRSREIEEEVPSPLHSVAPPRQIHTSGSCGSTGTRSRVLKEESSSRAESVARNFEELIQSNQTISYTLTPENMRDLNIKSPIESSVVSKIRRKSEDLRSPSTEPSGSPLTRRATQVLSSSSSEAENHKPHGPIPRAPPGLAFSTGRFGGPQAREARVTAESLADFAEFIKFTGPMDKDAPAPRNSSVPPTTGRREGASRRVSTASSQSFSSNNSRHRYRTRDSNPDILDHVDSVPQIPTQAVTGQHRIPRHVAPFRTTMDSDQFNNFPGGRAVDAVLPDLRYSQGSNSFSENGLPSTRSSNSSSALLKKNGPDRASKAFSDEDMAPVRKRRPPRDPYALDSLSDGEDWFHDARPPMPRKKEESLAEFLRDYDPPAAEASQPVQGKASRKGRVPGLMGRFSRGGSKEIAGDGAGILPAANGSGKKKHVPLMAHMPPGYDKYGPISGFSEPANPAQFPYDPARNSEARDLVASPDNSEMSEFLRRSATNTGPGSSSAAAPQSEVSGFSKAFSSWQKKTTSA